MSVASFKNMQWKHVKSKHIYQITGFPLREKDLVPQVSYRRVDGTGPEFTRTCEEFFDGRYTTYWDFGEAAEKPDDEPIALDFNKRSLVPGDVVRLYVEKVSGDDRANWGTECDRVVKTVLGKDRVSLVPLVKGYDVWMTSALMYVRKATPAEQRAGRAERHGP